MSAASRIVIAILLGQSLAAAQPESPVALRPIDRATVRIVSVHGIDTSPTSGRRTHVLRAVGTAVTNHGSGVAIGPQLVLTAGHVIWGAQAWVVFAPGSNAPIAAVPLYVDRNHDIAFLYIDQALPEHVELPEARQLTLSERVSVSGYPLDLREPTPAAASGEVSRITRRGELHLNMSVNPGHSGGPVIDAQGRLVGMLSGRGRLDVGVEGLAVAVTLRDIRAAAAHLPAARPNLSEAYRDLATAIAALLALEPGPLTDRLPSIEALLVRASGWTDAVPERDVTIAALAWNAFLDLLESAAAPSLEQLPASMHARASSLLNAAQYLANRALGDGWFVRRRFPIVRPILIGAADVEEDRRPPF